jgi:hypothetical protein
MVKHLFWIMNESLRESLGQQLFKELVNNLI